MGFQCKIVLSQYRRSDKMIRVYLQAIIDRKRALVPLGFYLPKDVFDVRRQAIKSGYPNAKNFETEFQMAIAKANQIASRCRIEEKYLTPELFREEFSNPSEKIDFIKFMRKELALKRPRIAHNTWKQHNTVINKLREFRKIIPFGLITVDLMKQFNNHLVARNKNTTVAKLLKIVKHYLTEARTQGITFKDPFVAIKIKNFKTNRLALSEAELERMERYYAKTDTPRQHKKLLRYFLFSCYTGIRISDIKTLTWNQLHDNILIFQPAKTKFKNEDVTVPVTSKARKYLPPFDKKARVIFDTYADPVSNRYIKAVAAKLDINKKITYHTSRHTFGSIFADGGDVVALQKIMGHGDIKTTMGYVHTSAQQLIKAAKKRFGD